MDPNTGRIHQQLLAPGEEPETAEQIRARGQVPIPKGSVKRVLAMSPEERKAWARKERNSRKAERRRQREARRKQRRG